jgi:hypothetical protein
MRRLGCLVHADLGTPITVPLHSREEFYALLMAMTPVFDSLYAGYASTKT